MINNDFIGWNSFLWLVWVFLYISGLYDISWQSVYEVFLYLCSLFYYFVHCSLDAPQIDVELKGWLLLWLFFFWIDILLSLIFVDLFCSVDRHAFIGNFWIFEDLYLVLRLLKSLCYFICLVMFEFFCYKKGYVLFLRLNFGYYFWLNIFIIALFI